MKSFILAASRGWKFVFINPVLSLKIEYKSNWLVPLLMIIVQYGSDPVMIGEIRETFMIIMCGRNLSAVILCLKMSSKGEKLKG